MKKCPTCGIELNDNAAFCPNCGSQCGQAYAPVYINPYDHSGEFSPQDVSENKVFCMLPYLMGSIGIIIAMLARSESPYLRFHIRQALKITIVNILLSICCIVAIIPILGWLIAFAALVMMFVIWIIRVISFFQVCSGRAVEPAIVRSLRFLK